MKKKICVITERYHVADDSKTDVNRKDFHRGLQEHFDCRYAFADDGWPDLSRKEVQSADAVLVYLRFRLLDKISVIDWAGFDGSRILYDEDSCLNRCHANLSGRSLIGRWTRAISRHRFSDVITTDYHFKADFRIPGVHCHWLPKYFNSRFIFPMDLERQSIGYFGAAYDARRAMLVRVAKSPVKLEVFRCPHDELNQRLNGLLGCVICNLATGFQSNWLGTFRRLVHRIPRLRAWVHAGLPQLGVKYEPTLGTMFKNFEIPAAGCAPIADWMEELSYLGYKDGKTAVLYRDFDELVEKILHYERYPDALAQIGRQAQALTLGRHSLENRMKELAELLSNVG